MDMEAVEESGRSTRGQIRGNSPRKHPECAENVAFLFNSVNMNWAETDDSRWCFLHFNDSGGVTKLILTFKYTAAVIPFFFQRNFVSAHSSTLKSQHFTSSNASRLLFHHSQLMFSESRWKREKKYIKIERKAEAAAAIEPLLSFARLVFLTGLMFEVRWFFVTSTL